jgi:hypothetical protein
MYIIKYFLVGKNTRRKKLNKNKISKYMKEITIFLVDYNFLIEFYSSFKIKIIIRINVSKIYTYIFFYYPHFFQIC